VNLETKNIARVVPFVDMACCEGFYLGKKSFGLEIEGGHLAGGVAAPIDGCVAVTPVGHI
jgi:hypothetical protein